MYESIKDIIEKGNYELADILEKINTVWLKSYISKEEMEELETLARTNANAENSYAPLQKQINNIYTELDSIKSRLTVLEGTEEPTEPVEEYSEYIQPTGAHDAYNSGRKIIFNGEKYICKIDGCVWDPITYPEAWEKVVENTEESEVEE